MCVSNKVVDI